MECPIAAVLIQFNHSVEHNEKIGASRTPFEKQRARCTWFLLAIGEDSTHHVGRKSRRSDPMRILATAPPWYDSLRVCIVPSRMVRHRHTSSEHQENLR